MSLNWFIFIYHPPCEMRILFWCLAARSLTLGRELSLVMLRSFDDGHKRVPPLAPRRSHLSGEKSSHINQTSLNYRHFQCVYLSLHRTGQWTCCISAQRATKRTRHSPREQSKWHPYYYCVPSACSAMEFNFSEHFECARAECWGGIRRQKHFVVVVDSLFFWRYQPCSIGCQLFFLHFLLKLLFRPSTTLHCSTLFGGHSVQHQKCV